MNDVNNCIWNSWKDKLKSYNIEIEHYNDNDYYNVGLNISDNKIKASKLRMLGSNTDEV
jgi:hypothetical protein